jgi:hypothetical protein
MLQLQTLSYMMWMMTKNNYIMSQVDTIYNNKDNSLKKMKYCQIKFKNGDNSGNTWARVINLIKYE